MTTPEMVERALREALTRSLRRSTGWHEDNLPRIVDSAVERVLDALTTLAPRCGACQNGVYSLDDPDPCPTCNGSGTQPGIYLGISADVAGRVVKATLNDNRYGRYWSLTPVESGGDK